MAVTERTAVLLRMKTSGLVHQDGDYFAYDSRRSLQSLTIACYDGACINRQALGRHSGNELNFRQIKRLEKAAVGSCSDVGIHLPLSRPSTRGIPWHLQESNLFRRIMIGLLYVDGARSPVEWRIVPGITSLEQSVEVHEPRLVEYSPCTPMEVITQLGRATIEIPQCVTESFDHASAVPLTVHKSAAVVGQRNSVCHLLSHFDLANDGSLTRIQTLQAHWHLSAKDRNSKLIQILNAFLLWPVPPLARQMSSDTLDMVFLSQSLLSLCQTLRQSRMNQAAGRREGRAHRSVRLNETILIYMLHKTRALPITGTGMTAPIPYSIAGSTMP